MLRSGPSSAYSARNRTAAPREQQAAVILCDRGTLDGSAYWPGDLADFFLDAGTTADRELGRDRAVIHLRTPSAENGYDHSNPLRTQDPETAAEIDARIVEAWHGTLVRSDRLDSPTVDSLIAAVGIGLLAYKGFTTITNTGGEIEEPTKNVGRAIMISIAIVTVVYLAVALAVRGNLGLGEIADARDFALAQAAQPVFGSVGFKLVAALAVIATVTSVMASMYSTSRMLKMMSDMDEVPEVTVGQRIPYGSPALVVTTGVAIVLTVAFDLSRIAALGAFAYLLLDMVVHYGHLRHLRAEIGAKPAPLVAAIVVDAFVFADFFAYRIRTDRIVIAAFIAFAVLVAGGETLYMRRFSDADGTMKDHEPGMS